MNVTVQLPSGQSVSYPAGTRVEEIFQHGEFGTEQQQPVVAALVNGAVVSLTYRIEVNSSLGAVLLDTRLGANVYRRSLCFLLAIILLVQAYPTRIISIN